MEYKIQKNLEMDTSPINNMTYKISNCCGTGVIEYPAKEPHYRCNECGEYCDVEEVEE